MSYEDKLSEDAREDLQNLARHSGMRHFLTMIDEIVDRMRNEIITLPLPMEPDKAGTALYAKRMQVEGAVALKNNLNMRIQLLKQLRDNIL